MSSGDLDNLVRAGLLKSEAADQKEFEALLDSGRRRLSDSKLGGLSAESRFTLAYDAAHAFSLAALRWHGYRSQKRYIVFQALQHTLEVKPQIWRVLDKCHQKRNLVEYEGYFSIDHQLLAELIINTELIGKAVEKLGPVRTKR